MTMTARETTSYFNIFVRNAFVFASDSRYTKPNRIVSVAFLMVFVDSRSATESEHTTAMRIPPHRHSRNCSWHFVYFFFATFSQCFCWFLCYFFHCCCCCLLCLLYSFCSVCSGKCRTINIQYIARFFSLIHTWCETAEDLQWQRVDNNNNEKNQRKKNIQNRTS